MPKLAGRSSTLFLPALFFVVLVTACGGDARPPTNTALARDEGREESGAPERREAGGYVCAAPTPEVAALVESLDEDPDILHADYTPSVEALGSLGVEGACAVLDALESQEHQTRMHAGSVLLLVLYESCGFVGGAGFRSEYGEERALAISLEIEFDARLDEGARRETVRRWRQWVAELPQFVCEQAEDGPPVATLLAALEPAASRLRQCGEPLAVQVHFGRGGTVTAIYGDARGAAYNQCVEDAVRDVRVPPFDRDEVWIRYAPGPRR